MTADGARDLAREPREHFRDRMKRIEQENLAVGKCPKCGGSGVIADLGKINRTGDAHINRRCGTCGGSGKPRFR